MPQAENEAPAPHAVKPGSARAWLLAARPKTLSGALIPVIVGCALAASDHCFVWPAALACAVFASLMQIAANFVNDYYDYRRGSDRADRLGPERACAQGWISPRAMLRATVAVMVAACAVGLTLLNYGGWGLVAIGAACVVFCVLYTTVLSYLGLGDLLVLVFFGWVPLLGTYYVQAGSLTAAGWWAATACGLVVDCLLMVNNYRDREADRLSGKRTLVVLLGETFGRRIYLALGFAACACLVPLLIEGRTWAFVLPLFYLPAHYATWRRMVRIHAGRALNTVLGATSRNMLLFALLLAAGLLLG